MATKRILITRSEKQVTSAHPVRLDELQIRRAVDRALEIQAQALVQISGEETRHQAQLLEASGEFPGLRFKSAAVAPNSAKFQSRDVLILLFLKGQYVLGIRCRKISFTDEGFEVSFPEQAFKIQRRSEVRYEIPSGYEMYLEMSDARSRRRERIFDLSPSGLAIRVAPSRSMDFFRVGTQLRGLEIVLQNRRIRMDGKVQNRSRVSGGRRSMTSIQVGIKITRISSQDREFLAGWVLIQAAQAADWR